MTGDDDAVVHLAGPVVYMGNHQRQRCAWCGATIIDQDLGNVMVAVDPDNRVEGDTEVGAWEPGAWIATHKGGHGWWLVAPDPDEPMRAPLNCCMRLDPEVTK